MPRPHKRIAEATAEQNYRNSVSGVRNAIKLASHGPQRSETLSRDARLAERIAPLIVPNRSDERSATHGLTHGRLWAKAAKHRDHRDFAAERDDGTNVDQRTAVRP